MNFFNWKKFTKQQWIVLGVTVGFLVLFLWNESEKRQPIDEAAQGLDELDRDLKKMDCDFFWKQQNWREYDQKGCNK